MGGFIAQVGKYKAYYGDYLWDYIKRKQPKEYYENYKFEINVTNLETGVEEEIEVPVLDNFLTIKKLRKNYDFEYINGNNLFKWLFNKTIEKERLFGIAYIQTHWDEYPTKWAEFFLKSKIFEFPIRLEGVYSKCESDNDCENNLKCFKDFGCADISILEIKTLEEIFWIYNNGLHFQWTDVNGNKYS